VELEDCNNFDEANEHARQHAEREGVAYLHPFASRANIAGTGILGLELDEQLPEMTHLAVQFGGGSLESGLGSVMKQLRPEVHVAAVQVRGCSPFVDSVMSGEVWEATDLSSHIMPSFFARLGGVGVGKTHPLTLGVGSRAVDSVDTVTSGSVYATMHDVQQELGVLPEFAGAVGLEMARKLARSHFIEGAKIVAVLTGNHADEYKNSYLERKSSGRRQEESLSG
jgi:threonine dehydratase